MWTTEGQMAGVLYIVSTPIGNYGDITLRALNILKIVDEVICEEFKEGRRLLKQYEIDKPLRRLSEHNEKKDSPQIIKELKEKKFCPHYRLRDACFCRYRKLSYKGGNLIKNKISPCSRCLIHHVCTCCSRNPY